MLFKVMEFVALSILLLIINYGFFYTIDMILYIIKEIKEGEEDVKEDLDEQKKDVNNICGRKY